MRVAFVVQRYGLEVNGGAELLCRWIAEHLVKYGDVHVITTCAQDYLTWKDHYPAGKEMINGVTVHRFPVDYPRDLIAFGRASEKLFSGPHSYIDELDWMYKQGPVSSPLLRYVEQNRDFYDVFFFFTYSYGTSYFGLHLVPEKAILVPSAHDEPQLYLSIFRSLFHLPRHIQYHTHAEQAMVRRVFGNQEVPGVVAGTGVDVPDDVDPRRFREKYGIEGDFIAYVGRIDQNKGVLELVDYFIQFKALFDNDLKLVLLGKGPAVILEHPDIISTGFVPDQEKFDALKAATALVLPSRFESLSIAVLEAWLMQKPVLVNGNCDVLRDQCLRSNGGLYYCNQEEFIFTLQTLLALPDLREELGRQGRAFTLKQYSWEVVEKKYLQAIAKVLLEKGGRLAL